MTETVSPEKPRRTDPRSFAVRGAAMLLQLVIPLAFGTVAIFDSASFGDFARHFLPFILVVIAANFAMAYLQWTRLTYAVGDEDIRVESGLLSRAARSVPYERIQDVSLEQKLLPRLFGLVEVKFETGAGGGDDLKLAYLSEAEGERLRETVRALRDRRPVANGETEPEDAAPEAETLFAMPPKRVLTFGLFEFSLAVLAVLGGLAQQFETVLPFDLWDLDGWQERLAGPGQYLSGLGPLAQVIGVVAAIATLSVVGVATGLVRTALREWDFRLERTDRGLRRRRGLVTRTDLVMPVHRVQALRIGTGFIRRLFGWHSLKVVSLASDSGSSNHDAAPFARMGEIAPIVGETGFALPPVDLDWQRPSGKAHFDGAMIDLAIMGTIAGVVAIFSPVQWAALVPLGFGVFAAMREAFLWRFNRHALGSRQLYSRHGWFAPSTAIGARVKLQSVELAQGPLARWRGYADLHFGLAGGKLRMQRLPVEEAREIRAAVLASMATVDFSDTMEKGAPVSA